MFRSNHISLQFANERARELRGAGGQHSRFEAEPHVPVEPLAPPAASRTLAEDIAALEQALAATPTLADVEHLPARGRVARMTSRAHRSSRPPVSRG